MARTITPQKRSLEQSRATVATQVPGDGAHIDHERPDMEVEVIATSANQNSDREWIETALRVEEETEQANSNEGPTLLAQPLDEEIMTLWNKLTVYDPVEGKEIHKATIAKLINDGIDIGSKSTDRTKRVQSVPRYGPVP